MYQLFYQLAIISGAAVMIIEGRRQKFVTQTWLLVVMLWVFGGIIGAELPHLIIGDAAAVRTAVGAVAGATLALVVGAMFCRIAPGPALDTTAIAIPIAGAFARLGCFAGECCQGIATSLPIGIADREGITRHPTQLYEAAFDVMVATWLTRTRRSFSEGHRFLISLGAMSVGRFAIEFIRDSEKIGPLSLAQWVVGPFAIACFAAVRYDIRFPRAPRRAVRTFAPAGMAVLLLQMPATAPTDSFPQRFAFWGIGVGGGIFTVHNVDNQNCDSGPSSEWEREHKYGGGSIEAGFLRQRSRYSGIGIRGRLQTSKDEAGQAVTKLGAGSPSPAPYSIRNLAGGVYADFVARYAALTLGVSAGHFTPAARQLADDDRDPPTPADVFPAVGLRLGPLIGPSIEARLGDEAPLAFPMPVFTLAVSGGTAAGHRLRFGVSDAGLLAGGTIRVPHGGPDIMPTVYWTKGAGDWKKHGAMGISVRQWARLPR